MPSCLCSMDTTDQWRLIRTTPERWGSGVKSQLWLWRLWYLMLDTQRHFCGWTSGVTWRRSCCVWVALVFFALDSNGFKNSFKCWNFFFSCITFRIVESGESQRESKDEQAKNDLNVDAEIHQGLHQKDGDLDLILLLSSSSISLRLFSRFQSRVNSTLLDLTWTYLLRKRGIHKHDESHGNKKKRTFFFSFPFSKDFCFSLVWYCRTVLLSATSSLEYSRDMQGACPKTAKSQV